MLRTTFHHQTGERNAPITVKLSVAVSGSQTSSQDVYRWKNVEPNKQMTYVIQQIVVRSIKQWIDGSHSSLRGLRGWVVWTLHLKSCLPQSSSSPPLSVTQRYALSPPSVALRHRERSSNRYVHLQRGNAEFELVDNACK